LQSSKEAGYGGQAIGVGNEANPKISRRPSLPMFTGRALSTRTINVHKVGVLGPAHILGPRPGAVHQLQNWRKGQLEAMFVEAAHHQMHLKEEKRRLPRGLEFRSSRLPDLGQLLQKFILL
jgi:hypothetical protein